MKISIYDKSLNRVCIVGEQFISCLWVEGYNTTEPFTLELNDTEEYRNKVKLDYYVGRADRKSLMVIKSVSISDGKIVVSGKQATQVLDDVAFVGTIGENKYVDKVIPEKYSQSAKWENVDFAETDLGVKYPAQISHKSFRELCEIMCQETDVGFVAKRQDKKVLVEFYQPEPKENLVFSQRFGNLKIKDILLSNANHKNYAIVLGAGEGENRKRVDVDLSDGDVRREIIIDAKDIGYEDGDTDESYNKKLYARGVEKMLERSQTQRVGFLPISGDFASRFDLGDVITISLPEYSLKLTSRVMRFSQKAQSNKVDTTVEVGKMTIKR